ncbi:hypothetical protein AC1031_017685 [Aphanomyces cochlioides]|nr:hypothetical protein AC1031_017685 [Aphanomyces cochlioides]
MELLNKEFFAFVQQQVVENPMSLWTKSIQEYIQHVEALEEDLDVLYGKKPTSSANSTKSSAAPFSFGVPTTTSTTPKESTSNGSGSAAKPPASVEKETTKASSVPSFTFGSKSSETKLSGFTFGTTTTTSTTATPSSSSDAAKPASSSTGFSFGDKPASTTSSNGFSFGDKPASSASSTGFSFGDKPASTSTSSSSFSFGDKPAASSTPSTGFSFGDKPAAASSSSGFSFGNPSTSTSSSGFSFGQPPKAPALGEAATSSTTSSGIAFGAKAPAPAAPAAGGFSFNLPKPAATASAATPAGAAGQGGDDDEDDENIGREEATVIIKSDSESNETVLFEEEAVRLRQFKSAEKEWANLGSHAFKLLQNKTTKATRILVRNSIGKIMVNAALYAGMKVQANPKSLVMPLMNDGKLANYLFAMAPARVADLKKEIDNSIPKE